MAKQSSYRLTGRLNASRVSRLAFLTYLNSGGKPKKDGGGVPPGPSILPHRAWRVVFNQIQDPNQGGIDPREIEFIDKDNVRHRTGGTPISRSGASAAAFDGDTNSRAQSDFSGTWPQWMGYDFGVGNEKDIRLLRLWSGESMQRSAKNMSVEYSDNMVDWVSVAEYPDIPSSTWQPNFSPVSADFPLYILP